MSTKYITNPMLHIIVLFYSSMYVLFNYVCYECLEIRYGVAFHCFCSVFVPSVSVFDPPSFVEISTLGCGIHVLIGMQAFAIDMGYPAGQDFEPRNVNEKIVYNLLIDNRASLWSRLSNLT